MSRAPWAPGDTAHCIRDDWEAICPGYVRNGDEPHAGERLPVAGVGTSRITGKVEYLLFSLFGTAFEAAAFERVPA